MAKHRLKQKKYLAGKQWWADFLIGDKQCSGRTPVSHDATTRTGAHPRCGHYWEWHDNVVLKYDAEGNPHSPEIRCRGAYWGLTPCACTCRDVYPSGEMPT